MTSILLHFTKNVSFSIDKLTKNERPLKGAFLYYISNQESQGATLGYWLSPAPGMYTAVFTCTISEFAIPFSLIAYAFI